MVRFCSDRFWNQGKTDISGGANDFNFALIDFGIKAKQPFNIETLKGNFALIDFGIKAKLT